MNNKKGFIASSMIYSFFLVFIAILTALVSSYITNKTIHLRFNEEVIKDLNGNTHSLVVYSKDAAIQEGVVLQNLVENGNFEDASKWTATSMDYFNFVSKEEGNGQSYLESQNVRYNYVYQNVIADPNHTFYSSIEYLDRIGIASSNIGKAVFNNGSTNDEWVRYSSIKTPSDTGYSNLVRVGDARPGVENTGSTFITNVMLVDLTSAFGENREPNAEWLDKYLPWFDGNINMRVFENVKKGNQIEFVLRINANAKYDETPIITCTNKDGDEVTISDVKIVGGNIDLGNEDKYNTSAITIPSLDEDLVCNVTYNKAE